MVYSLNECCIITCNFHVLVNELYNLWWVLLVNIIKNILIDLHSAVIGDNDHNGKLCKEHSEEKGP